MFILFLLFLLFFFLLLPGKGPNSMLSSPEHKYLAISLSYVKSNYNMVSLSELSALLKSGV